MDGQRYCERDSQYKELHEPTCGGGEAGLCLKRHRLGGGGFGMSAVTMAASAT